MFVILRKKEGKPVSASSLDDYKLEMPPSPHGIIFGGRVLQAVTKYVSGVANKHAEVSCENIGIDYVRFFATAKTKDLISCSIAVNKTWGSIIEVGVKVIAEDFRLLETKKILSAYFSFRALDEEGKDIEIAEVIPETLNEKRRYAKAEKRKQLRKKNSYHPFNFKNDK